MELETKKPPYHGKFNGQGMITLSFDDGREDFYRVIFPIMQKYGLVGTFHIITGWIDGSYEAPDREGWESAQAGHMSLEQIKECHKAGFEISGHGDLHENTEADVTSCVNKLKAWGVSRNGIVDGFASPGSGLTFEKLPIMQPWMEKIGLTHARSANAPEAISSIDMKNNMSYPPPHNYRLTSQVVTNYTTMTDLMPVMNDAIVNKKWCILMLHSILYPADATYNSPDNWWWDVTRFEALCKWLSEIPQRDLLVVTMRDGYYYSNQKVKENAVVDRRGHIRQINSQTQLQNTFWENKKL